MKDTSLAPSIAERIADWLNGQEAGLTAEAFSQLYDRAHLVVYRYVYGLCGGPPQEVEDLTAETFLRAWRGRGRFTGNEEAALGWLLQIARRLVIDAYRRRSARPPEELPPPEGLVAADASPEEQALLSELWHTLWRLLQQLPADQREMLVLRYMLGWRVKRIARHFAMADNTVSASLRRILLRLRRDWPQAERLEVEK